MSLAAIETSVVSATLFACRRIFGYVYSNEKEVVDYVTVMAPLVCISVILDSIQGVLTGKLPSCLSLSKVYIEDMLALIFPQLFSDSGIARGCGWQHLGVYVNLGAFYLCGIPVAAILAFWVNLRGKGLWIGVQVGSFVQTSLLSIITICINWEQQVCPLAFVFMLGCQDKITLIHLLAAI